MCLVQPSLESKLIAAFVKHICHQSFLFKSFCYREMVSAMFEASDHFVALPYGSDAVQFVCMHMHLRVCLYAVPVSTL